MSGAQNIVAVENSINSPRPVEAQPNTVLVEEDEPRTFLPLISSKIRRRLGFIRHNFLSGLFVDQTYVYPVMVSVECRLVHKI